LGQVSLNAHDLEGAADWFQQSSVVRHGIGDRSGEGWMYLRLAALRNLTGDRVAAHAHLDDAAAAAADAADDALSSACADAARGIWKD
jgi:hypothetical protein